MLEVITGVSGSLREKNTLNIIKLQQQIWMFISVKFCFYKKKKLICKQVKTI